MMEANININIGELEVQELAFTDSQHRKMRGKERINVFPHADDRLVNLCTDKHISSKSGKKNHNHVAKRFQVQACTIMGRNEDQHWVHMTLIKSIFNIFLQRYFEFFLSFSIFFFFVMQPMPATVYLHDTVSDRLSSKNDKQP